MLIMSIMSPVCFCSYFSPFVSLPPLARMSSSSSSTNVLKLDRFRSTRTRIAKRPSTTTTTTTATTMNQLNPSSSPSIPLSEGQKYCDWSEDFLKTQSLRVIFIGHNPSDKSWEEQIPYAHKSNRFWKLLSSMPALTTSADHQTDTDLMNDYKNLTVKQGIGFIDLFVEPGSDASKVHKNKLPDEWRLQFLRKILAQTNDHPPRVLACVSKIVANKLLGVNRLEYGFHKLVAECFQLDAGQTQWKDCQLWILPSTSGRAVLSWEDRLKPFVQLSDHMEQHMHPWTYVSPVIQTNTSMSNDDDMPRDVENEAE